MSDASGARIYDVGYRAYDGLRHPPRHAVLTIWYFTLQRVLGLRRRARHKVIPAVALVIAFLPALVFAGIAGIIPVQSVREAIVPSYGEYVSVISTALAVFASFVAPQALCSDRRTGMLDLYLAGPLDVRRYLVGKWAAVAAVMTTMTIGPQLFILVAYSVESAGPSLRETPLLLLRIVGSGIGVALFYTAVALAASSLTTRRAVAAVAIVLVLYVPQIVTSLAVEERGAPAALALASRSVATEFAWRVYGEVRDPGESSLPPLVSVSTPFVVLGFAGWIALGAIVCLVAYGREGGRR